MSVTRDKSTGKWMSQVRVKDWTGKEIHKKKRGFNTKKEALQWERDFISQADGSLGMKFKDFVALYMKDADPRLRETTLANKHYLFDKKVLPYFGEMPINAIKPTDIRNWQNELIHYRRPNGKCYSPTYLRTINNQLTAAFNFAVKFYGLRENPCHKAGTMGKKNADENAVLDKRRIQGVYQSHGGKTYWLHNLYGDVLHRVACWRATGSDTGGYRL